MPLGSLAQRRVAGPMGEAYQGFAANQLTLLGIEPRDAPIIGVHSACNKASCSFVAVLVL
jgi:hypothetical protein